LTNPTTTMFGMIEENGCSFRRDRTEDARTSIDVV